LGTVLSTTESAIGLELRALRRVFDGGIVAVESIDLSIAAGEIRRHPRPSGSGKSTMLRMIAGLDHPTSGSVNVTRPPRIAYVFFRTRTCFRGGTCGGTSNCRWNLSGIDRGERESRALAAIEQVGLADAIRRYRPSSPAGCGCASPSPARS
jgi:ABC-type nitrate/sulfonate/bicarbonate transport system ATPase subunit